MKLLIALAIVALAGVQDSTVYTAGNGVSLPAVVKQVKADYTNEAKQNRIEGTVGLDVVVQSDGAVGDVTVVQSLDSILRPRQERRRGDEAVDVQVGDEGWQTGRRPRACRDGVHAEVTRLPQLAGGAEVFRDAGLQRRARLGSRQCAIQMHARLGA